MRTIVYLLLATALTGCASRQKIISQQESSFKFDSAVDTTASFSKQLQSDTATTSAAESSSSNLHIDYEGQEGDSISVTEYGADGKVLSRTTVQGKGKATFTKGDKKESAKTEAKQQERINTSLEATGSVKASGESSNSQLDKNVKSSGFSIWFWLWIIIICIVLVLLWYLNRQFGWFTWLLNRLCKRKPEERL